MSIPTYGLTHIALAVHDPARSARFYQRVLGAKAVYRSDDFVQLQTPGSHDVIVLERGARKAGKKGGVTHFGFRLRNAKDINRAAATIRRAGGTVVEQGEFVEGEPYLFAHDLDGYVIEVWFEIPTPFDPPAARR